MLERLRFYQYDRVKMAHLKEYAKYFDRVSFTLNDAEENNFVLKCFTLPDI